MKRILLSLVSTGLLMATLTSCFINIDPNHSLLGSNDEIERSYQAATLGTFDRLDMGSAFFITVVPGSTPSVTVRGDRRDVEEIELNNRAGTLELRYSRSRLRRYTMRVTVTMPTLRGVAFSGASKADVSGFRELNELSIDLSGASKGTFDVQANRVTMKLSGASKGYLRGGGNSLRAEVGGASELEGFDYPFNDATLEVSGASHAYITVNNTLTANANGASKIRYRGSPTVNKTVSGASKVEKD